VAIPRDMTKFAQELRRVVMEFRAGSCVLAVAELEVISEDNRLSLLERETVLAQVLSP